MISWTVLSFFASSFVTFAKASFILSKAHSETFASFLKVFLYGAPLSTLQGEKAMHHHSVRAVSVIAALNLLQVLFGWRIQRPLTLCTCWPCFFGLLSEPFYSCCFLAKILPHLSYVFFLSLNFQSLPRCAFLSPQTHATATLSMVRPLLPSETRCNNSGINCSCMNSSPSLITTDCQKLRVFSLH